MESYSCSKVDFLHEVDECQRIAAGEMERLEELQIVSRQKRRSDLYLT